MKYRKKPIVIEAFQMTEERRKDNRDWPEWLNKAWQMDIEEEGAVGINPNDASCYFLVVNTLEGIVRIDWNDWIIKGVKGEVYPCKPDVFTMTYDPL